MNQKSIFESQKNQINSLQNKVEKLQDSVKAQKNKLSDQNYFTLQENNDAMIYFENEGYSALEVENFVTGWIYDQNLISGNNPLVPLEGMYGEMKINKVKFLNHKWIIADFSDGKYWGEMLLEYSLEDPEKVEFQHLGSFIYPWN